MEAIDFPRTPTFSGRRGSQHADELASFIALLKAEDVRSYLEIGARHGDTFHAVMTSLPRGSRGLAVDLPGGAWGKPSSRRSLDRAVADLKRRGYSVTTVYGDSTHPATREFIGRAPFDAALIDGDHRYDGVRKDWEAYGPLARLVAFHDIAGEGQSWRDLQVQVPRLWRELRGDRRHVEFIGEASTMGIGVILQ